MASYKLEDIDKLEEFFKNRKLPADIQLDKGSKIVSPQLFVENHISNIRKNIGKQIAEPFFERLLTYKKLIEAAEMTAG